MKELDIYIAIEGPIGVGKTSLAKLIADKLNARKVFEKFEENPFLKDFYDDPESNAFKVCSIASRVSPFVFGEILSLSTQAVSIASSSSVLDI